MLYLDPSGHSIGSWFKDRWDDFKTGVGIIKEGAKEAASYVNQKVIRPAGEKISNCASTIKDKASQALTSTKNKVCSVASNAWSGIKSFAKNTFGAEYSVVNEAGYSTDLLPAGSPIQISSSQKVTDVIEKTGDSSKPISVYARSVYNGDFTQSSAGLKINVFGATLNVSVGLRNIGATVSYTNNNDTYFLGANASICDFDVSGNIGSTTKVTDTSSYTQSGKLSVNGMFLVAVYCWVQGMPYDYSPSPSPSPVPAF